MLCSSHCASAPNGSHSGRADERAWSTQRECRSAHPSRRTTVWDGADSDGALGGQPRPAHVIVSRYARRPVQAGCCALRSSEEASHAGRAEGDSRVADAPSTYRRDPTRRLAQLLHGSAATVAERERNLGMDPFSLLLFALIPLIPIWLIWMALFLTNDPGEEIRAAKHHQFLGPGGPDDPFAD